MRNILPPDDKKKNKKKYSEDYVGRKPGMDRGAIEEAQKNMVIDDHSSSLLGFGGYTNSIDDVKRDFLSKNPPVDFNKAYVDMATLDTLGSKKYENALNARLHHLDRQTKQSGKDFSPLKDYGTFFGNYASPSYSLSMEGLKDQNRGYSKYKAIPNPDISEPVKSSTQVIKKPPVKKVTPIQPKLKVENTPVIEKKIVKDAPIDTVPLQKSNEKLQSKSLDVIPSMLSDMLAQADLTFNPPKVNIMSRQSYNQSIKPLPGAYKSYTKYKKKAQKVNEK